MNTTFIKNKNNGEQLELDSGQPSCELTNAGTGLDTMGKSIPISDGSWVNGFIW